MKRQMSKKPRKNRNFSTQLLASASLFCILVLQKNRSEFFLIHHSLKKYLHFSHTWLDNKYSIFAIKVHRFFLFILIKFWYWKYRNRRTLGNSRYQSIVKATVSGVFEDLKFKISEDSDQNWSRPNSVLLVVSV